MNSSLYALFVDAVSALPLRYFHALTG